MPVIKFVPKWRLSVDDAMLADSSLIEEFSSKSIPSRDAQMLRNLLDDILMEQMHTYDVEFQGLRETHMEAMAHRAEAESGLHNHLVAQEIVHHAWLPIDDQLLKPVPLEVIDRDQCAAPYQAKRLCYKAAKLEKEWSSKAEAFKKAKAQWLKEVEELRSTSENVKKAKDDLRSVLFQAMGIAESRAGEVAQLERHRKGADRLCQDAECKLGVYEKKLDLSPVAIYEAKEKLLKAEMDWDSMVAEFGTLRRS
ncbi:hypothetical protein NE237_029497 [Protea cynaroides]|uniref:Uncharacterized protein n=1 Tax=Protea cynaroides TaxID=273540 RepID=A0A9Q0GSE6_9MAGN|nr:hypothetical protein NE237_029497 [Protea cynaroides]